MSNPIYEVPVSDGDAFYPTSRVVPPSPEPAFPPTGEPVQQAPAAFPPTFDSLVHQDAPVQPAAFPTNPPETTFSPPAFVSAPPQDAVPSGFPAAAAFPPPSFTTAASDVPPPVFSPPAFAAPAPQSIPQPPLDEPFTSSEPVTPIYTVPEAREFIPKYAEPALNDAQTPLGAFVPTDPAMQGRRASSVAPATVEEFDVSTKQGPLEAVDSELLRALNEVVLRGASDLHVSSNARPMVRIDGALTPVAESTPWSRAKVQSALESLLTPSQLEEFESVLELDFAYSISADARFRVNFYQQRGAIGAAFRLIPTEIKKLADLGLPPVIGEFSKLPRGLVLVTGPTGSGKSTTLAALIDLVNRTRTDHIVTVEDPIEFLHGNQKALVNQREVGSDTHSFANALKHVLRQDPDVILIGELRDLETMSVALTAAETGHLVFATLHTQDAAQTIDRVIDVFPPHQHGQVRSQLAATLQGVVCQTLVKKAGKGGRAVATEVLVMTPAISNLIREGKTFQIHSVLQAGREQGMHTLDQNLADLVNQGVISHATAYERAQDPQDLDQLIQRSSRPGGAGVIDYGDSFSRGA